MSNLSRLSHAIATGRKGWSAQLTREKILAALLRKRAQAHRVGLTRQEAFLRDQIAWSLPVQHPRDEEEVIPDEC
jgi:hypothetical protein